MVGVEVGSLPEIKIKSEWSDPLRTHNGYVQVVQTQMFGTQLWIGYVRNDNTSIHWKSEMVFRQRFRPIVRPLHSRINDVVSYW